MCLIISSRYMVESSLLLDRAGFETGTDAGERLAREGAVSDGCSLFGDTESWVTNGIGAGAYLAV